MSKSKDRARAESGLIFRDGHLVRKEEWYAAHPTPEMKRQQQTGVDQYISELKRAEKSGIVLVKDGKVLDPKDASAVIAEAEPYYCTKCKVTHRHGKIHQEHHQYASQISVV